MNPNGKTRSVIRDSHGFEVPEKLVGSYLEHSGKWSADEKRRTDKWLQFLRDISPEDHTQRSVPSAGFLSEQMTQSLERVLEAYKTDPGSEFGDRFEALVQNGIPSFLRGHVWTVFLGYDSERIPGLFRLLCSQAEASEMEATSQGGLNRSLSTPHDAIITNNLSRTFSQGVFTPRRMESLQEGLLLDADSLYNARDVEQIDKDITRTFPRHPNMDQNGLKTLREILVAFSLHRPDIGYCQGMNFISGLLLLFNKPEDAFWNLIAVIERLLPSQFEDDMSNAVVDRFVFKELVQQYYPELAQHLKDLSVDVCSLCPQWFLSCFVSALPTETCLRVWDVLFLESNPSILFKVALALVESCQEDLLAAKDAVKAWELLQNMASYSLDSDSLIRTAMDHFPEVEEQHISNLRRLYHKGLKEHNKKGLLSKGSPCGLDDNIEENNTPTRILAASDHLISRASTISSTGSALSSEDQRSLDFTTSFRTQGSTKFLNEVLGSLQDHQDTIPEELGNQIFELIERFKEKETETCQLKVKLSEVSLDERRTAETNESLKLRLSATKSELDKKTECLDHMIAKSQILNEKLAAQEEIICKQRRQLFNGGQRRPSSEGPNRDRLGRTSRSLAPFKNLLFTGN